jgi:hypothetical protein
LRVTDASHGPDHSGVACHLTKLGAVLRDLADLADDRANFGRAAHHRGHRRPPTGSTTRLLPAAWQGCKTASTQTAE